MAMKFNRILAAFLSTVCLASCADFLTEGPTTSLSEDTVYSNEANLEAGVIGVYQSLTATNYGWTKQMGEFIAYPSILIHWKDNRTAENYVQTLTCSMYATSQDNQGVYDFIYQPIYKCNKMIEALVDSPVDQTFKNEIEGEAKLVRAIDYFTLTRLYGNTPLVVTTPKTADDSDAPRASYMEIYKQIIADLEYAEQNMRTPERQAEVSGTTGRPNKWAATSFKAAVYAQIACIIENQDYHFFDMEKHPELKPDFTSLGIETAADAWQKSLDAAEKVINEGPYELAPNFGDLFNWGPDQPQTYQLKERIFVLNSASYSGIGLWTAQRTLPQWPEGTLNSSTTNNNWGRNRPSRYVAWKWAKTHGGVLHTGRSDKLTNLYKSCPDPRFDKTFFYWRYVRMSDGKNNNIYPYTGNGVNNYNWWDPFWKKYWDPTFNVTAGYADFYLMRYAEVILYAAEAAASLSKAAGDANWQKAMDYMEMIHKRARDSKSGATHPTMSSWNAQTPSELVDAIMWERVFELTGECHEFYDTHRRGAKWMSEWLCKPLNEFLDQPEQNFYNASTPERNWFNMIFNSRKLETDYQKLRKGILLAFPEEEIRDNAAIGDEDQNDFYYSSLDN